MDAVTVKTGRIPRNPEGKGGNNLGMRSPAVGCLSVVVTVLLLGSVHATSRRGRFPRPRRRCRRCGGPQPCHCRAGCTSRR